jgi:hypothetical protein
LQDVHRTGKRIRLSPTELQSSRANFVKIAGGMP